MKKIGMHVLTLCLAVMVQSCAVKDRPAEDKTLSEMSKPANLEQYDSATFGAGCFWCVEAIYQSIKGVVFVESGYSGGHVKNPGYKEVCSGLTGHAEVAKIWFDPAVVSYETLLEVFWHVHDPTTMNRQGNDVGTQYRSVIFYHTEEQREQAMASKDATDLSGLWSNPIVTAIEPLTSYYPAEDYHQNYYNNNPEQGYCSAVVGPKVQKFRKQYAHLLK